MATFLATFHKLSWKELMQKLIKMILVTLQKVFEISKNRMALSLSLKTKVIKRGMIIKQKKCKKGQVTENYLQKRLT